MAVWMRVIEDTKRGGLIYVCPAGHKLHQTSAEIAAYVSGKGPDRPETCKECGGGK